MEIQDPHIDFETLIVRCLNGDASVEELQEIQRLVESDTELMNVFIEYKTIWDASDKNSSYNAEKAYSSFYKNIVKKNTHGIKISGKHRVLTVALKISGIAAALLILIGVYLNVWHAKKITIVSMDKVRVQDTLPDNTLITMNKNSHLTYSTSFSRHSRDVTMTGEVFFKVSKDLKKPFIVTTDEVAIKVLGTGFDIKAYSTDSIIAISVESGSVLVYTTSGKPQEMIVVPGTKAYYNKNTCQLLCAALDDPNYVYWINNQLVFDNTPLLEVVAKLENVFNIKMQIDDDSLKLCNLTAKISTNSFDVVAQSLTLALHVNVVQEGNVYKLKRR